MKRLLVATFSILVVMATVRQSDGILFQGQINGTFTENSSYGMSIGDTFKWGYSYEAEFIDGNLNFSLGNPYKLSINTSPFFGTQNWDAAPVTGSLSIQNGIIVAAFFIWHFEYFSGLVDLFRLGALSTIENQATTFSDGVIEFTSPVAVTPNLNSTSVRVGTSGSTAVLLALGLASLGLCHRYWCFS